MTTVNEALGGLIEKATKNPRSTWGAVLTCTLFVVPTLLACQCIGGKTAAVLGAILSAAKLYVGADSIDAKHVTQ